MINKEQWAKIDKIINNIEEYRKAGNDVDDGKFSYEELELWMLVDRDLSEWIDDKWVQTETQEERDARLLDLLGDIEKEASDDDR